MIQELFDGYIEDRIGIWQECFGDSPEYIQRFLSENSKSARTFGVVIHGKLVSVAYLLPAEYVCGDFAPVPVYYLYAAATTEQFRNRGCFSQILEYLWENIEEPVILVPANKDLIGYYEKRGMRQILFEKKEIYENLSGKESAVVQDISAEDYLKFRDLRWRQGGYIRWNYSALQYILSENENFGGICRKICIGKQEGAALARKNGDTLEVLEITIEENKRDFLEALCGKMDCSRAVVQKCPDVMVYSKTKEIPDQIYFNLFMG